MNPSDKFKGKNHIDEEEPKGPYQICFRKNHTAGTGSRRTMCQTKCLIGGVHT